MLTYPYTLTRDTNRTWLVRFPDIPEAITVGADKDDAAIKAREALEAALEIYVDERRPIPPPSQACERQASVTLDALMTSKVLLSNERPRQDTPKTESDPDIRAVFR